MRSLNTLFYKKEKEEFTKNEKIAKRKGVLKRKMNKVSGSY